MYAWLIGRFVRRANAEVARGNPRLVGILVAKDIEFVFPGNGAFAQHSTSRPEFLAWLSRRTALAPELTVTDVLVSGPPWSMRIAMRIVEKIGDDYTSEAMEYVVARSFKVRSIRVFLDTEVVSAWEALHPELA